MKNNFLESFVKNATNNSKTAFIYRYGISTKKVTFNEFLEDVYKMNSFLNKNLHGNNVLVFSYPYSYMFFVGVFSCVFLGKNIVIMDSFSDKKKTKKMMESADVSDVITDSFTSKISFIIPEKINKVKIDRYIKEAELKIVSDKSSIVTFTSGTTGIPKKIERKLDFLESQISLIKNNMIIREDDITYGLLPMYTLFSVLMNNTCLVSKNINDCNKYNVTMLLAPIKKIWKINKPLNSVQRTFLGGAILYKQETLDILQKLPASEITYVYGASEGAVIYKTNLNDYKNNLFTFDIKSNGIDIEIIDKDKNGAGEIMISGETVIGKNNRHFTGDYGKLIDGKLILLGRKKYSCSENNFYNYEFDEKLREQNRKLKNAFSFYYGDNIHVAYSGKIKKTEGIIYHHFLKLPYDMKHKTKLDYAKVIQKIDSTKS